MLYGRWRWTSEGACCLRSTKLTKTRTQNSKSKWGGERERDKKEREGYGPCIVNATKKKRFEFSIPTTCIRWVPSHSFTRCIPVRGRSSSLNFICWIAARWSWAGVSSAHHGRHWRDCRYATHRAGRSIGVSIRVVFLVVAVWRCQQGVFDFPDGGFGPNGELEIFALLFTWVDERRAEKKDKQRTVILSQYLYTIITLKSIQSVKKNKPSM